MLKINFEKINMIPPDEIPVQNDFDLEIRPGDGSDGAAVPPPPSGEVAPGAGNRLGGGPNSSWELTVGDAGDPAKGGAASEKPNTVIAVGTLADGQAAWTGSEHVEGPGGSLVNNIDQFGADTSTDTGQVK